jgi:hypothetical protein
MMDSEEVEFNPWGPKKFERAWTFGVNLSRETIHSFCAALEDVMTSRRGGVFYFPNKEDNYTRCRYDWFVSYRREVYGLRISLVFDVKSADITEINAYLSLGPRLVNQKGIQISHKTEKRVLEAIKHVLNEAGEIIAGKTEVYHPLFYVKLSVGKWIGTNSNTDLGTIYRSACNMQNGEVMSALAIKTLAYSKNVARARALSFVNKLAALMSLLAGEPVVMVHPRLPKRGSFHIIRKEPPDISKVYPSSYHLWEPISIFHDIKDIATLAMNILKDQVVLDNDKLWQSIYAYATALDVQKEYPTLASVAYIASLSTFAGSSTCNGIVTCSVCGLRPSHPVYSEPDSITELVSKELGLTTEKQEQIRSLIRAVYSKQRSAYVHDAILRHQESGNIRAQVGRPGQSSPISEELLFAEQLSSIRYLARRVLLMKLPKSSLLQSLIDESSKSSIPVSMPIAASITIGRRPVGLRMHP